MGIINVYCLYSKISQVYSAKFTFLIIGVFYLLKVAHISLNMGLNLVINLLTYLLSLLANNMLKMYA